MKGTIMMTGGGTRIFAAIGVTYPVGSTLTCTNGTKTFTAKNTNGRWIFSIPRPSVLPESWRVTATDGTSTKYVDVEITAEGQSVNVDLFYSVKYYDAGNSYEAVTGGYKKAGNGRLTLGTEYLKLKSSSNRGYLVSTNAIDVTDISYIEFDGYLVVGTASDVDYNTFGLAKTNTDENDYVVKGKFDTSRSVKAIDTSKLTGLYYIKANTYKGDHDGEIRIYRMEGFPG